MRAFAKPRSVTLNMPLRLSHGVSYKVTLLQGAAHKLTSDPANDNGKLPARAASETLKQGRRSMLPEIYLLRLDMMLALRRRDQPVRFTRSRFVPIAVRRA